ncbi:MAG: alpha-D-ribose 1-methylphosphonate 5-triphosphate diphosphatase [Magnetospirillum sp.]|nr:alpha-D-ribose 1-methylphosphonate 5-triphosphate diphosphatase [Magnetospirillum sp.]
MNDELILTNARIVTDSEVFTGTIHAIDGRIVSLAKGGTRAMGAVDCGGDTIVPGLVELHTDNLEKHFTPRPGVRWHSRSACLSHDAQMAAAGITTVYDAVSLGDMIEGSARQANLEAMIHTLAEMVGENWFRAEHRLHLRCEVSSQNILDSFNGFLEHQQVGPMVGIVSLMDHTPGQRQFVREDKYREYYMGKYGFNAEQMKAFTQKQQAASALYSDPHRQAIAGACRGRDVILATHDDATIAHVEEAASLGIHFSEFPTTVEAAKESHKRGMQVLMGAPNLVRGGSHSGNVSALDLAREGCLDVLSSDYVPASLIHAAFLLHHGPLAWTLPDAMALVSKNPAQVAGLADRGSIDVGKRADLVRVVDTGDMPVVRSVWRQGKRIS